MLLSLKDNSISSFPKTPMQVTQTTCKMLLSLLRNKHKPLKGWTCSITLFYKTLLIPIQTKTNLQILPKYPHPTNKRWKVSSKLHPLAQSKSVKVALICNRLSFLGSLPCNNLQTKRESFTGTILFHTKSHKWDFHSSNLTSTIDKLL